MKIKQLKKSDSDKIAKSAIEALWLILDGVFNQIDKARSYEGVLIGDLEPIIDALHETLDEWKSQA